MTQALANRPTDDAIEQVLVNGDLSKLTPAQRVSYYNSVCTSLDLNPLTKPFAYISLNGKLVLYALKDCTEQLRNRRAVSVTIAAREIAEDCYVVTARASLPTGRQDESIGAVSIGGLKGESRANAMMKAETKAKRRVTLSICGLGMLDETEIDSIPGAQPGYVVTAPVKTERQLVAGNEHAKDGDPVYADVPVEDDDDGPDLGADLPAGASLIVRCQKRGVNLEITTFAGATHLIYKAQLQSLAEQCCQDRQPVTLELKRSGSGNEYVIGITKTLSKAELDATKFQHEGDDGSTAF